MNDVTVTCRGGISVISAFATGIGSASGIDLPLSVHMERGQNDEKPEVLPTLYFLDEKFGKGTDFHVEIDSFIPSAMGLKSSSAFTLGIVLSYLELNRIVIREPEIIKVAAEASIRNGTSLTGAADDLCCSYYGGLCLADNRNMKILMHREMEELPILLLFSEGKRNTGKLKNIDFSPLEDVTKSMVGMVKAGKILETICLNGFLYGTILGIDTEMIGKLYEVGATFAGQSGKGPAVFGIFRTPEEAELAREELRGTNYAGIVTRFSNRKAVIEHD